MIYRSYRKIRNIKTRTKLWACAYEFNNNKKKMCKYVIIDKVTYVWKIGQKYSDYMNMV